MKKRTEYYNIASPVKMGIILVFTIRIVVIFK